jgi:hypothetical protein
MRSAWGVKRSAAPRNEAAGDLMNDNGVLLDRNWKPAGRADDGKRRTIERTRGELL